MKRPSESDYTSLVAYTRALEAYCDARRWVGLTNVEIGTIAYNINPLDGIIDFARAIEAKLKEKNT